MRRVARTDFVFSDGTVVPAGSEIAVAALATNTDEVNSARCECSQHTHQCSDRGTMKTR